MRSNYLILGITSLLVLTLDQATKLYIDRSMALYSSITVVENFFNITYLRNKGAAFGFLAKTSYRLPFFIFVTLIAVVVITISLHRLRADQRLAAVSLSLIFTGAIGNLIDRLRMGEVIDFLDAHWYGHHWPAFNIADSAICVGVFLLAVDMIREEQRQKAGRS
jgi:signal peptidase II